MIAFKHQQHASILAHLHGEWSFAWVKNYYPYFEGIYSGLTCTIWVSKMIEQVCYAQTCCGSSSHWDGVHHKGECIQGDFVLPWKTSQYSSKNVYLLAVLVIFSTMWIGVRVDGISLQCSVLPDRR